MLLAACRRRLIYHGCSVGSLLLCWTFTPPPPKQPHRASGPSITSSYTEMKANSVQVELENLLFSQVWLCEGLHGSGRTWRAWKQSSEKLTWVARVRVWVSVCLCSAGWLMADFLNLGGSAAAHAGKKPEESKLRPGKRNISTSVRKLMMAWRLSGGWRESINPKTNTNIGEGGITLILLTLNQTLRRVF